MSERENDSAVPDTAIAEDAAPEREFVVDLRHRDPLAPDAVMSRADLLSEEEQWGPGEPVYIRESGAAFGRPVIQSMPGRPWTVEAVFAFDLDELGGRQRYTAARFSVALLDERILARRVRPEPQATSGPAAYWSFGPGADRVTINVSGLHSHRFACAYRDPRGQALAGRSYLIGALLVLPDDVRELRGTLAAEAAISRTIFEFATKRVAFTTKAVEFAVPVDDPKPAEDAAVRLCFAVDVERYSRHPMDTAARTQRRLVAITAKALEHAGVAETSVWAQEQGDGRFLIFPPGIDESRVIPDLIAGLQAALRTTNRDLGEHTRVRLRVAFHRGLVSPAHNGYVGEATTAVHRILDSHALRDALTGAPESDYALIVPDLLYRDVISQGFDGLDPSRFKRVTATLKNKKFTEDCWIHVP